MIYCDRIPLKTNYGFPRRGPDQIAEELATVLSRKAAYEFKPLFLIVYTNLRARNAGSGGEEMVRLRAYEKLQNRVQAGIVKKTGKKYRGVAAALATFSDTFFDTAAELNAKFASGVHSRPPTEGRKTVRFRRPVAVKFQYPSGESDNDETKLPVREAQEGLG